MTPRVSVVVPAYNRAGTVRAAVESALAQTITDIEVIVVDDRSSDDTLDVVAGIADDRLRVIAHPENLGAAAARNSGVAAASGEWIALLDSDDTWRPDKLERQLAALDAADGTDAAICGVCMRLLDQRRSYEAIPSPSDDWLRRLLADCGVNAGATLMVRRTLFTSIGPMDESLARFEDWDWLIRHAAAGGSFVIVPEALATVNNRRGRLGRQTEAAAGRFLRKHASLRARYGAAFARRTEANVWMQVAGTYAFANQWDGFARAYARAVMRNPGLSAARLLRAAGRHLTRAPQS